MSEEPFTITICYIILNTCKSVRRHVFVIVYLRQKTSSDKIRKKKLHWSGLVKILKYWPVNIRKYWPVALTKTNRENKNIKYNITIEIQNSLLSCIHVQTINMSACIVWSHNSACIIEEFAVCVGPYGYNIIVKKSMK